MHVYQRHRRADLSLAVTVRASHSPSSTSATYDFIGRMVYVRLSQLF